MEPKAADDMMRLALFLSVLTILSGAVIAVAIATSAGPLHPLIIAPIGGWLIYGVGGSYFAWLEVLRGAR